jgi:hypothetical protein
MKLDREYQRALLKQLDEIYPKYANLAVWKKQQEDRDKFAGNITYLYQHGLVSDCPGININNEYNLNIRVQLTAKGADFLLDDGGLSSILGSITVKFHEDTIRALIDHKISTSDLDPRDKQILLDQLKRPPSECIKHLTTRLLDFGLANLPELALAIQTVL